MEYNLRLFFFLLYRRFDIYHSNDLDTLLPMWLTAFIFKKKLVYDSHEYFLGVPSFSNEKSYCPKVVMHLGTNLGIVCKIGVSTSK